MLSWAREGTFKNCLYNLRRSGGAVVAVYSNRAVSRSERLNYCLSGQFLEVSYNVSLPGGVPLTGLHKSRPDKRSAIRWYYLGTALQQHRLNMADGARRVQPLRTYTDAVHDAMAAEYAESIT